MIELEPSFQNRTGRQNDESTREHETVPGRLSFITETSYTWSRLTNTTATLQIYTAGIWTRIKSVKVTSICHRYYHVKVQILQ